MSTAETGTDTAPISLLEEMWENDLQCYWLNEDGSRCKDGARFKITASCCGYGHFICTNHMNQLVSRTHLECTCYPCQHVHFPGRDLIGSIHSI